MEFVEWRDLEYDSVQNRAAARVYSGQLRSGSILAVIGHEPNKALDCFATTGRFLFPDRSPIQAWQKTVIRDYKEPMFPMMTVEETVGFGANFVMTGDDLRDRIDSIIDIFGLAKSRNEPVGPPNVYNFDGRRRVILVASKLVLPTALLILFDPFEDLEPVDAHRLMSYIRRFADETRTPVILSMTHTRQSLIDLVDQVMLITLGGKAVFHGSFHEAIEYFVGHQFIRDPDISPLSWLLELVSVDYSGPSRFMETLARSRRLAALWADRFVSEPEESRPGEEVEEAGLVLLSGIQALSGWRQFILLTWRCRILLLRDGASVFAVLIQVLVPVFLTAFIYININPITRPLGLALRTSLFFSLAINNTFSALIPAALFYRSYQEAAQREKRLYRAWLVPLSKLVIIVPFRMLLAAIAFIPLYYIAGLRRDGVEHMFIYIGIIFLNILVSATIGVLIGALTPNLDITQIAAVLIIDIFILFGGLTSATLRPSWVIRWIQYLSPIFFTFRALLRNELVGRSEVNWAGYLSTVELEVITIAWAVGGLLMLAGFYLALVLLASIRISSR